MRVSWSVADTVKVASNSESWHCVILLMSKFIVTFFPASVSLCHWKGLYLLKDLLNSVLDGLLILQLCWQAFFELQILRILRNIAILEQFLPSIFLPSWHVGCRPIGSRGQDSDRSRQSQYILICYKKPQTKITQQQYAIPRWMTLKPSYYMLNSTDS